MKVEKDTFLSTHKNKILALAVACLTLAVYSNIITAEFVWDDQITVVGNKAITSFSNIDYVFTNEFAKMAGWAGKTYRPIQELSYIIDYALWKYNATGFHLTNVLLHIACSIALFYLIYFLTGSGAIAFISSAFFGIHPLNTEAVSYITGRSDPLYLLFFILAFLFYLKARGLDQRRYIMRYLASLCLYGFSLLSRETALMLPLLLFAYEWISTKERRNFYKPLPFVFLAVLYGIIRQAVIKIEAPSLQTFGILETILTDIKIISQYLSLLVLPAGLHMERRIPLTGSPDSQSVIGFCLLAAILLLLARVKSRRKEVIFFSLWFILLLAPYMNIVKLNALMAEHWMYGAGVGIYVLIAFAMIPPGHKSIAAKKTTAFFAATVIFFLGASSFVRNFDWRDEPSIYLNTLHYTKSARVMNNLAIYYQKQNEYDKAIELYKMAIAINPRERLYHESIATLYMKKGDLNNAIHHWEQLRRLDGRQNK